MSYLPPRFTRTTMASAVAAGLALLTACVGEVESELAAQLQAANQTSAAGEPELDEHDEFDLYECSAQAEDDDDDDDDEIDDLDTDDDEHFDEDDSDDDMAEHLDEDTDCESDQSESNTEPDTDTGSGTDTGATTTTATDNPTMHANHCQMTPDFVDLNLMTHTATQSGPWTSAQTWGGMPPVDGAIVHIPAGFTVTVDDALPARLETVRIDGTLEFATDNSTEMYVDTLFSSCAGLLQIGSATNPVQPEVSARVIFIDDGPVADNQLLSRGAILMGSTRIHGTAKTHRAILTPQAVQGDSELSLDIAPTGWQPDDQLIVTGTVPDDPESDEIRRIASVNGQRVTLDAALDLDHRAPQADLNVYVANASRNVEFISENTTVSHRGHIMLMSLDADIRYARFTELGRTDKTIELDDFQFDFPDGGDGDDAPASANVIPLGGSNIRGRYSLHFHRAGTQMHSVPARVEGSVVFNGPGWGFVNHSSHVDFVDNVSYGLQGAGFYTEAGDEIGRMQGNIAIRSVNSAFSIDHLGAIDPDLRAFLMDYGNDGDGFWLTGNRVSMIDNVAAGASAHGIIYWTDGIIEADTGTRISVPVSTLTDGHLIPGRSSIPVWWAPLAEVRGNESYGATVGFRIRYVHAKNYLGRDEQSDFHRSPPQAYIDTLTPTIEDLTVWGNRDGVLLNYNERMSLLGARIVGYGDGISVFSFNEGTAKSGIGFDIGNESTHGPGRIENVLIEGFGMGMATPVNGLWSVENLTLRDNGVDLLIQPPETDSTVTLGNAVFDTFEVYEQPSDQLPAHILLQ